MNPHVRWLVGPSVGRSFRKLHSHDSIGALAIHLKVLAGDPGEGALLVLAGLEAAGALHPLQLEGQVVFGAGVSNSNLVHTNQKR